MSVAADNIWVQVQRHYSSLPFKDLTRKSFFKQKLDLQHKAINFQPRPEG